MDIYNPYKRKKKVIYASWEEVFQGSSDLVHKANGNFGSSSFSFFNLKMEYEFWQDDVEVFLRSLGVKDDKGFSRTTYFETHSWSTSLSNTVGLQRSKDKEDVVLIQELKIAISGKNDILRLIKDTVSPNISTKKIFDYVGGQYYLNGKIIYPSKTALYYVLFDATYNLSPNGGDILYSTLKTYLVEHKIKCRIDKRNKTFSGLNIKEFKKKVNSNLLGGKGILGIAKIAKHLKEGQKKNIFFAIKNGEGYTFNNKQ